MQLVSFCSLLNVYLSLHSSHRSTLIQDILRGNRGCENTQKGTKKSHLHHLEKGDGFLFHAANDESEIENRLLGRT